MQALHANKDTCLCLPVVSFALAFLSCAGNEVADEKGKRIIFFGQKGAVANEKSISLIFEKIESAQVLEVDIFFATTSLETTTRLVQDSIAKEDFYALAKDTRNVYQAFVNQGATVETPDPVVNDFFKNLLRTLYIQISAQGGASPLSRYTNVWTRDLSGFVRPFVALGYFETAKRILDTIVWLPAVQGT